MTGHDVAVYPSSDPVNGGKIVVAADESGFAVYRFNSNGTRDTTFDGDGRAATPGFGDNNGWSEIGLGITLQSDGKVLVVGTQYVPGSTAILNSRDFAIARFNVDGSLDASFGGDGTVTTSFEPSDSVGSIATNEHALAVKTQFIAGLERIIVGGYSNGNFAVARYDLSGTLDPTFGVGGIVTTNFGYRAADPLNPGTYDIGNCLAVQNDGKIVLGGWSATTYDVALARYEINGVLDPTFGTGGLVTTDFGDYEQAYDVAVQPDGKIVLAGHGSYDGRFLVARYTSAGILDNEFGDGLGAVSTPFGRAAYERGLGVALQADGKIVLGGGDFYGGRYLFRFEGGDTPPPPSALLINDADSYEWSITTTFTVTLTTINDVPVTVNYATADGTAIGGLDYVPTAGTLVFEPGETRKTVMVPLVDDRFIEPTETFFLNLSAPTNATIQDSQATGTIRDEDLPPSISINNVALDEGDEGTVTATFIVQLSRPATETITVDYATADANALAGSDYEAAVGTLIFNPFEIAKTIEITVNSDIRFEQNEWSFVKLSNATNATISGSGQGQGTIRNDDTWPLLTVSDVTKLERSSGSTAFVFTVNLSKPYSDTVTVRYATADGTAKSGKDYQATSGTLTFAPGETTKTITVYVKADRTQESNEVFYLNLFSNTNASIADNQGLGTIQDDD